MGEKWRSWELVRCGFSEREVFFFAIVISQLRGKVENEPLTDT